MDTNDKIQGVYAYILKKCEQEAIAEEKELEKMRRKKVKRNTILTLDATMKKEIQELREKNSHNDTILRAEGEIKRKYKTLIARLKIGLQYKYIVSNEPLNPIVEKATREKNNICSCIYLCGQQLIMKLLVGKLYDDDKYERIESANRVVTAVDALISRIEADGIRDIEKIEGAIRSALNIGLITTEYEKAEKGYKESIRDELMKNNKLNMLMPLEDTDYSSLILPNDIESHSQFIDEVQKTDAIMVHYPKFSLWVYDKMHPCEIIDGNIAWISKDKEGICRYFTMAKESIEVEVVQERNYYDKPVKIISVKHIKKIYGFNIWDMIEIIEGLSIIEARENMARLMGSLYPELKWEYEQINKYINNKNILENARGQIKECFPNLYEFIGNYIEILMFMNQWAMEHIMGFAESYENESMFFITARTAESKINISYSSVNRAVNAFSVLKLIQKINLENVPINLRKIGARCSRMIDKSRFITFYCIPLYTDERLTEAENIVLKLKENRITNIQKIKQKKITELFGEDYANKIYGIRNEEAIIEAKKLTEGEMPLLKYGINDIDESEMPF